MINASRQQASTRATNLIAGSYLGSIVPPDGIAGPELRGAHPFPLDVVVGVAALMACIEPSTAGPKVYLASRVVGYAGHVVAVCWGLFIVYQWTLSAKEHQRILDSIK